MQLLGKNQYSGTISELNCFPGFTIGLTHYDTLYKNDVFHCHENPHISLLLEGGHIERRLKKDFQRLPGDVLFCNTGEPHQFITKRKSKNINIEFEPQFLSDQDISEFEVEKSINANFEAKFTILKIFKELAISDNSTQLSIELSLLDLITAPTSANDKKRPSWFKCLLEILHDRWNEHLSLDELSILTQVHPVTISKYSAKYLECTLGEYKRKLKISKSLGLIKNSKLSLTEIAFICGFSDQSHFIRTFKNVTGYLPKKFENL
ncbi:helix-turn-helix transcriptional regulator [Ulvibacterium sp.]|uniref:helix-turn-helix transcriptional regulator n=1 Tax=Ulvibacterium sp. TaxID=2665914 RepID=UPI003BAB8A3C